MDKEIEKLVRENNELLHKLHNAQVRGRIFRFIYWGIIIILALIAFHFIQPYVEQATSLYSDVRGTADQIREVEENGGGFGELLDFLKNN